MGVFVVMLRAIGPVTHKIMSMAQWRQAVADAGFDNPETYVATGNLIASGEGSAATLTDKMDAIVQGLGLGPGNKAILRSPLQLQAMLKSEPFPEACAQRPGEVGIHFFAAAKPDFSWVGSYVGPERIHIAGDTLIVDYTGRQSSSRLPAIIEKKSGTATARNWNTLRALAERSMARHKQG